MSVREGKREPDGPYEGVPPHLAGQLLNWIESKFKMSPYPTDTSVSVVHYVAMMHRLTIDPDDDDNRTLRRLLTACAKDECLCLDVIDNLLNLFGRDAYWGENDNLTLALRLGGSVFALSPDGGALVRRIDPTAAERGAAAVQPGDVASDKLASAWEKAYGRNPDAAHAWSEAIKAVEAVIPLVCPNKAKANLGGVAGDLKGGGHAWQFELEGTGIGGVLTLEAMLRLLWPDPGRHPDGTEGTPPTIEQAQAAVQLAVTIVQWIRSGALLRR